FFFAIGGAFAMLIRAELFSPGANIMDPGQYNRAMTFHGAIMVFMVIIPGIPAFLGNFILPMHIGAKDVAFPRVNLMSWYCLMVGFVLAAGTMVLGGVDNGWTFYTPYSISYKPAVIMMAFSVFVAGFSSILTGVNFIATVHRLRAPGMSMNRMPLFVWAIYSTAILQVLATPVLGITVLLLAMENIFGI